MLWLALHRPPPAPADPAASPPEAAAGDTPFPDPALACWAGRFTPRVVVGADALRLEVGASLRLFGGLPALIRRVRAELAALGIELHLAAAPTPLAALWLARAGDGAVCTDPAALAGVLAPVPLAALQPEPLLARRFAACGLRRLGDLLELPRASLGPRFGRPLLLDLARALGEVADPQEEFAFPERFEQALELPAPVEAAPVLLFAARRLVAALCGWLAARNAAVRELEWRIGHGQGRGGANHAATTVALAFSLPAASASRIERVLKERLDALALPAPALDLRLLATRTEPRAGRSQALFEGAGRGGEALAELVDRLVARLGPQSVQGLACHADHRPERASRERAEPALRAMPAVQPPPRPLWLVEPPEPLRERGGRPQREGPLHLLAGPERIEAGWWDGADARRDYFVAADRAGRRLWIYRDPRPPGGWFLHGIFS